MNVSYKSALYFFRFSKIIPISFKLIECQNLKANFATSFTAATFIAVTSSYFAAASWPFVELGRG